MGRRAPEAGGFWPGGEGCRRGAALSGRAARPGPLGEGEAEGASATSRPRLPGVNAAGASARRGAPRNKSRSFPGEAELCLRTPADLPPAPGRSASCWPASDFWPRRGHKDGCPCRRRAEERRRAHPKRYALAPQARPPCRPAPGPHLQLLLGTQNYAALDKPAMLLCR